MLTVEVPEEVGVPLISPAVEIDNPAGRPVASAAVFESVPVTSGPS